MCVLFKRLCMYAIDTPLPPLMFDACVASQEKKEVFDGGQALCCVCILYVCVCVCVCVCVLLKVDPL